MINPLGKSSEGNSASQEELRIPVVTAQNGYPDSTSPRNNSNISPRGNDPIKIFKKTIPMEQTPLPTLQRREISVDLPQVDLPQKDRRVTSTIQIKKKGIPRSNDLGNGFTGRRSLSEKKLKKKDQSVLDESLLITPNPIYRFDKKKTSNPEIYFPHGDQKYVKNINPLYQLDQDCDKNILTIEVKVFKNLINAIIFSEDKSVEKLLAIMQACSKEKEKAVLIDSLCDILKTKKKDKLNRVIALAISKAGNEKFFCGLTKDWRIDVNEFSKNIAIEFRKDHNLSFSFLLVLKDVTNHELESQNPQTLFREQNFSSALCREYARIVWRDELEQFCSNLSRKLEKTGPHNLCLTPQLIEEHLVLENPSFKHLTYDLREKQIQKRLHLNIESFKKFTQSVLLEIFNMKISDEIKQMLICRRSQITKFLSKSLIEKNDQLEELSRTYISEVLILRILNPKIISLAQSNNQNPFIRSAVVNLSKIIQALGNQAPFDDDNKSLTYQVFRDLYDLSIKDFRNFIDQCSSGKNDKEHK